MIMTTNIAGAGSMFAVAVEAGRMLPTFPILTS